MDSMQLLAHFDPRTQEPLGVWRLDDGVHPELCYSDPDGLAYAESLIDDAVTADWSKFAHALTERTPYAAWWEFVETDRAVEDELEDLRQRWAGVNVATSSPRFAAAARRLRFHRFHSQRVAEQVLGTKATELEADRRVSATITLWESPDGEQLVVVVGTGEKPRHIDAALAYGLTFHGDRDLHMVLPDETMTIRGIGTVPVARPTLHRVAHLASHVFVWTHAEVDELHWGKPLRRAGPAVVPPRYEVLRTGRMDEALKVGEHDLGDRADWILPLTALVEEVLGLDPAPRLSYLAWHADGRQLLKIKRSGDGLEVTAGTDYSAHRTDKTMATVLTLTGPPSPDELTRIRAAIEASKAERDDGTDAANLEHLLQSRLATATGVEALGLVGQLERELPASRPSQRRAYIDLVGVDARGDIHVIETKIGLDPMLVLQGLDYWVWATEHRTELIELLRSRGHTVRDEAVVRLDFVIGTKNDTDTADLRYVTPQLEALDGSISWRVGLVNGWATAPGQVTVDWSARRSLPATALDTHQPRFATRLHTHLQQHHDRHSSERATPLFLSDVEAALHPAARLAYRDLASRGLLHRYIAHIRSSQQFALNLFGGLHGDALIALARRLEPAVIAVSDLEFEYRDPSDLLGESSHASPHATQADIAMTTTLGNGRRHLILIEVKLTEDDFGHCTAYEDPNNDRTDGCHHHDSFESGPAACFKLANHNRGGQRHYNLYVAATTSDRIAGCPFRRSNNQPMRNVALAQALVDAGDFDHATVALCAPDTHRAMWRRWDEFKQIATARNVTLTDLPASAVLGELPPKTANSLAEQYAIVQADDATRLLDAIDWARAILQRVGGDGTVLDVVNDNIGSGKVAHLQTEQRLLAQRLEVVAEATRSARADLVPPLWE